MGPVSEVMARETIAELYDLFPDLDGRIAILDWKI
jgi:hypothetical protein